MLGILLGLIFVEQRDDLAHHDLGWVVAQLLRDRDQPHAMLGELAQIEFQPEGIAEEARERVHDDDVERVLAVAGALDHALELRALVVGGRSTGLNIFGCDAPAALGDPGFGLRLLVRDREVVLGLPAGRDSQINRGAQSRGGRHGFVGLCCAATCAKCGHVAASCPGLEHSSRDLRSHCGQSKGALARQRQCSGRLTVFCGAGGCHDIAQHVAEKSLDHVQLGNPNGYWAAEIVDNIDVVVLSG